MVFGGLSFVMGGVVAVSGDQIGEVISLFLGALSITVDIQALKAPGSDKLSDVIVFIADIASSINAQAINNGDNGFSLAHNSGQVLFFSVVTRVNTHDGIYNAGNGGGMTIYNSSHSGDYSGSGTGAFLSVSGDRIFNAVTGDTL